MSNSISQSLSKSLSKIPSKLPTPIDHWRKAHKLWSVRLSAFGALLMSALTVWPDRVWQIWQLLPNDVRRLLPEQVVSLVATCLFVLSAISRLIKQSKLNG